MSKNPRELPKDRLGTTDEKGNRVYLYPADVRGRYRSARYAVHAVLILFILLLPWIRINGHQAVLLDLPRRNFSLFGVMFHAHDAPLLVFIFGGAALTLAFVTAIWGRLWCGWACPQTVFIDSVFRRIERWTEGDSVARRQRDSGPWTVEKIARRAAKWLLFLAVTLVLTHSFLAYFVGTDELALMIRRPPAENIESFLIMFFSSAVILFDFGWFREQFCTIVCPYGRFQSVLMDGQSLVVGYDARRGEPRKGEVSEGKTAGDCVNCYRCVQVCPTGIDIRRGTQLECIACTACIDACDDVMTRLHKPRGLIRYDSEAGLLGQSRKTWHPRTLAYLALLALVGSGLTFALSNRKILSATFVRTSDPYQVITRTDGTQDIVNRFSVDFSNRDTREVRLSFEAPGAEVVTPAPVVLPADGKLKSDVFLKFPKALLSNGRTRLKFQIRAFPGTATLTEEVPLVGPFQ